MTLKSQYDFILRISFSFLFFRQVALTSPKTGRQSVAENFPCKTGTHWHLGRVRKWRLIIFPKDRTRSTDARIEPRPLDSKVRRSTDWANVQLLYKRKIEREELRVYENLTVPDSRLIYGLCAKPNKGRLEITAWPVDLTPCPRPIIDESRQDKARQVLPIGF